MERFIRRLQHKSKATRDYIALAVAGGVTVMVAAGWLFFTPSLDGQADEQKFANPGADRSPFNSLTSQISSVFSSRKEALNESLDPVTTDTANPSVEDASWQREYDVRGGSATTTSTARQTTVDEPAPRVVRIVATPAATTATTGAPSSP